jgi:hypothetical protein
MGFDHDFRRRADAVRAIPLERILRHWGALRDRSDKAKWHLGQDSFSVTGAKFTHWQRHTGGGGAIDLVMHVAGTDVRSAVAWLEQQFGAAPDCHRPTVAASRSSSGPSPKSKSKPNPLRLPEVQADKLEQVRRYLIQQRRLDRHLLDPLIETGKLYADWRANAVFLMVAGKANRPIGAELRGTGHRVWRGLAAGTRKDRGYFWIGNQGSSKIVLCEAAIDAISCFQLLGNCICISTAGVRPNPVWLSPLLARGYTVHCGYDNDEPGETAAREMIARHASIRRLRPPGHDWNDAVVTGC